MSRAPIPWKLRCPRRWSVRSNEWKLSFFTGEPQATEKGHRVRCPMVKRWSIAHYIYIYIYMHMYVIYIYIYYGLHEIDPYWRKVINALVGLQPPIVVRIRIMGWVTIAFHCTHRTSMLVCRRVSSAQDPHVQRYWGGNNRAWYDARLDHTRYVCWY